MKYTNPNPNADHAPRFPEGRWNTAPIQIVANPTVSDSDKAPKRAQRRRYFALHEEGLRNGSFFRVGKYGIAQWVNGDCMGSLLWKESKEMNDARTWMAAGPIVDGLPTTYAGQPLVEFPVVKAELLIPKCCL